LKSASLAFDGLLAAHFSDELQSELVSGVVAGGRMRGYGYFGTCGYSKRLSKTTISV
jgi:hypothetical protein